MSAILEIRNVSKAYANHVALRDVSMLVERQSIFGLLGPNGAGKTSLIRIINQITGPDKGELLFDGQRLAPQHIAHIGYLPEERGLYKKMEVGEQALYLAQLKGLSHADAVKRIRYWFEKFEMQTWWNKKVEELSKGMQQKVQFIVTLVHEPQLLILDEPFTGFDPINASLIRDELLALNRAGTTIMLSTHRMETVEELCTHIALINKSRKVLDGAVNQLRKSFKTNIFQLDYVGNASTLLKLLSPRFELLSNAAASDNNVATLRIPDTEDTNSLLRQLLGELQIIGFKALYPSMNDIFIEAVKKEELI
jgi:ABC-2 type transport system ATP-binding protein